MGEVIAYDPATWCTMKMVKGSIAWYEKQPRENDLYGTARKKEKAVLKELMYEHRSA